MKLKTIEYLIENKQKFYLYRICQEIVQKEHFDTEEHITKFNSVITIDIVTSFEHAIISIKCNFLDTRYNYIYTDLYFKKHIKNIIVENIDNNQYYKSYITKKNMISLNYSDRTHFFQKNLILMI